jgi:hypothetical protein
VEGTQSAVSHPTNHNARDLLRCPEPRCQTAAWESALGPSVDDFLMLHPVFQQEVKGKGKEFKAAYINNEHYIGWKNIAEAMEDDPWFYQVLDRVDQYMMQREVVPPGFVCPSSGKVLRNIIGIGKIGTFDFSILEQLPLDESGRCWIGENSFQAQDIFKGLAECLVEKDVWRMRERFLNALLCSYLEPGGDQVLAPPDILAALNLLCCRCQEKEHAAHNEVRRRMTEMEATHGAAIEHAETLLMKSLCREFYVSLGENGAKLIISLPQASEEELPDEVKPVTINPHVRYQPGDFGVNYPGVAVDCVAYYDPTTGVSYRLGQVASIAQQYLKQGSEAEGMKWQGRYYAHRDVTPQTPLETILSDPRLCKQSGLYKAAKAALQRQQEEKAALQRRQMEAKERRSRAKNERNRSILFSLFLLGGSLAIGVTWSSWRHYS